MKVTISKPEWQSEEHTMCVTKMLQLLSGVEILEERDDAIDAEVSEEAKDVLDDMNMCDYLTIEEE